MQLKPILPGIETFTSYSTTTIATSYSTTTIATSYSTTTIATSYSSANSAKVSRWEKRQKIHLKVGAKKGV